MKIPLLISVFVILTCLGYSQISFFTVESFLDNEDNSRISYLKIEGVNNIYQADNLQNEIIKHPLVYRFTFSEKKDNLNKCIIQADNSLNEFEIEALINEILVNYQIKETEINEIIYEMPEYIDTGNLEYDNKVYRLKKEEWINNNPEKYKILTQHDKDSQIANEEKTAKEQLKK